MRFHFLSRHDEPHDGSAALAPNYLQSASHKLGAFAHSNEPDTLVSGVRRKSAAMIFHLQTYGILLKL
jgi:hypothetical protein